jgi:alkylation response protein AidB-like acyl-CoA dehydrogenase
LLRRSNGAFACQSQRPVQMLLLKTTAIDKGDHYLLNGTKNWINGSSASTYIVIAQTDIEKGHKGINAFIVKKVGLALISV